MSEGVWCLKVYDIISGPDRWQGSGVSPAAGGQNFWAFFSPSKHTICVCINIYIYVFIALPLRRVLVQPVCVSLFYHDVCLAGNSVLTGPQKFKRVWTQLRAARSGRA